MSDEVKPRKSRRRHRSRKKKAAVTIESIAPGRAPLGVYHSTPSAIAQSHHGDNQAISPSSSEWSKVVSNRDSLHSFIQLSSGSPFSTLTPAPQHMSSEAGGSFSLHPAKARSFTSFFPQTPSTSISQYSPQSIAQSSLLSGKAQSLPRNLFPLHVSERLIVPKMTSKGHFIRPYSQAMRSRNLAAPLRQDTGYELHNFDDLPSSHPVSLSALCTRGSSRNKGSKSWKPLQLDSVEGDDIAESTSNTALLDIDQNKPRSRLSALHRANSGDCNLNRYKEEASLPSRFCSQQYNYEPEQQSTVPNWQNANTIHYQDNPLNYSHNYDFSYAYSHSQRHSYMSQSPFLRTDDYQNPEHLAWPSNLHSVPNELSSMGMPRPILYNQSLIADGSLMPDSSFNIYRASFDHPDNQSPYQSIRIQGSHYGSADTHEAFSTLHSSLPELHEDPYLEYSPFSWEPSSDPAPERVSSFTAHASAIQSQLQTSAPSYSQLSSDPRSIYKSRADIPTPNVKAPHNDTKIRSDEEKRQELKEAVRKKIEKDELEANERKLKEELEKATREKVEEEELGAIQMRLQCNSLEANATHPQEDHGEDCQVINVASIQQGLLQLSESNGKSAITDNVDSGEVFIRERYQSPMTEQSDVRLNQPRGDLTEKLEVFPRIGLPGYLNIATGKRIRPPPGISEPAAHKSVAAPSISVNDPILTRRRLDEANNWFHRDARGEEQLRKQVEDIAQSYTESFERLNATAHTKQESTTAKQLNLLLGNVIVNLRSYVSENFLGDAAGFANFRDAKSQHSEPILVGRRSYFDRDPSVDHWRLPLGRAPSTTSNKTEQSFSSTHTRPLQAFQQ
ncbi:hypothetical protein BBP40_003856 [Aspergillus hancockii]|nr:hypothetical protein BBP40_003856 [Aspergillus hancockii]